jgi:hypothetical protein
VRASIIAHMYDYCKPVSRRLEIVHASRGDTFPQGFFGSAGLSHLFVDSSSPTKRRGLD